MIVRQGDVTLIRVADRYPEGEPAEHVLAVGEESGHWHAIRAVLEEADGVRLVTVREPTEVRVEGQPGRHPPILLQPGTYRVQIGREYRPEGIRNVQD